MTTPHWTTLAQFAADVDAAIAKNPQAWELTRAEKDAWLERADADILAHYGYAARSGKDMVQ